MKNHISIGIMAHNEDKNISKLLDSIFEQKLNQVMIDEIIVISSGSTDNTNNIVISYAKKFPKIKLLTQKKRLGKASAVNLFLSKAKNGILVLMSADLILKKDTLENIILPFKDPKTGIVGSHPVPVNNPNTLLGYASHLLWQLHHQISLKHPKMGEMIAFRKIFKQIPVLSAVDEANIEPLIRGQGFKPVYQPSAVVYNKGPESLDEFLAVRRRVYAGHLAAKYEYSYEVSTLNSWRILGLLLGNINPLMWQFYVYTPLVIILESYGRLLGLLDYNLKLRDHSVWQISHSSKKLSL